MTMSDEMTHIKIVFQACRSVLEISNTRERDVNSHLVSSTKMTEITRVGLKYFKISIVICNFSKLILQSNRSFIFDKMYSFCIFLFLYFSIFAFLRI